MFVVNNKLIRKLIKINFFVAIEIYQPALTNQSYCVGRTMSYLVSNASIN